MRSFSRLVLLLALSFPAAAADGDELQNLYKALDMLDQQQRAIYQQFQMVQQLRRPTRFYGVPMPGEVTNYDEVVAAQERAIQREEALYREADALLARYAEIEDLKEPLQARVYELSTQR